MSGVLSNVRPDRSFPAQLGSTILNNPRHLLLLVPLPLQIRHAFETTRVTDCDCLRATQSFSQQQNYKPPVKGGENNKADTIVMMRVWGTQNAFSLQTAESQYLYYSRFSCSPSLKWFPGTLSNQSTPLFQMQCRLDSQLKLNLSNEKV